MKRIIFTVYHCEMSDELYLDNIMIYKPFESFSKSFDWNELDSLPHSVTGVIEWFKVIARNQNVYITDCLNLDTIYIKINDELLGFTEDKQISDIFSYFEKDLIEFAFFVVGGASFHYDGYLFIVHPNEEIHKNTPHVHVRRDEEEVRYCLDTLERFPNDKMSRRFSKDEKKRIIPFLRENKDKLYEHWNLYVNGYTTPAISEEGKQFYKES